MAAKWGIAKSGLDQAGAVPYTPSAFTFAFVGPARAARGQFGKAHTVYPADTLLILSAEAYLKQFTYRVGRFGRAKAAASNAGDVAYLADWAALSIAGVKQFVEKKSLQGTVTFQGNPVPYADIYVIDEDTKQIIRIEQSDANGNVTIPIFEGKTYMTIAFKKSLEGTNAAVLARITVPF